MSVKCQGCGNLMYDDEKMCPFCRLPNPEYKETETAPKDHTPKTINELKQWYIDRGLPPEQITRFFIGSDIKEARAFGIYRDEMTGEVIVYKNKSDGSRAIRYQGTDEAYAVSELLAKLKEEILNQKSGRSSSNSSIDSKTVGLIFGFVTMFFIGTFILIVWMSILLMNRYSTRGYYHYKNDYYYRQNSSWYMYDDHYGWTSTTAPSELEENYRDYKSSDFPYYNKFEDSKYYEEPTYTYSDSGSDDDYSWSSSDSWDSSSTDWDSDW